jgi:hypothetical protein
MPKLIKVGNVDNIYTQTWYCESEEEVAEIVDAPLGSTVMILTESELKIKMLRSTGWVEL